MASPFCFDNFRCGAIVFSSPWPLVQLIKKLSGLASSPDMLHLSSGYRFPAIIAGVVILASFSPLCSQEPTPAIAPSAGMVSAETYNDAMKAFQQGNYSEAADGLSKVLASATDPTQQASLGPVYFTLGSAYFNIPDYPKAIETFTKYLEKYPRSEQILEVRLAIAKATFLNKDYAQAAKRFQELESIPQLREQALTAEAQCYKAMGRPQDEIPVLTRLMGTDIKTPGQANAAVSLAEACVDQDAAKAANVIAMLQPKISLVENLIGLNAAAVKTGDKLAEDKKYQDAIDVYRTVKTRQEVLDAQNARIAAFDQQMDANLKAAAGNPQETLSAVQTNNELKVEQAQARDLLKDFEKIPDFTPALLLRVAKCWYDWDKKWESIVVLNRVLDKYPDAKERETALFSKVVAYADLGQAARCQDLCAEYLKEFPHGPNANTVGFLSGATALQAGDPKGAATLFGTMLERQPNSEFAERMRYLVGNAMFSQGNFDDALKDYATYERKYPGGQYLEEVKYRSALALVFAGKYEEALAALNTYLQQYPRGQFESDAKYRVMVCDYAAQLYDEIIQDVLAWRKEFPNDALTGEVLALLGDCLSAEGKDADAIPVYVESYKKANTDEVLNYSLFQAGKLMQKQGKWNDVAQMFQEFVKNNPNHSSVVAAMYSIGKALAHEGKIDEAKRFLVEQLKTYINDPKREAVEQLLQQLVQLCAKRPPVPQVAQAAPSINQSPVPQPAAATPPPYDAAAELEKQLAPLQDGANATGNARLLYAKAEMAALRKKPDEHDRFIGEIADRFKPGDLSPLLLAQVGDYLLSKGDRDHAAAYYTELKDYFPKSSYADYAYVGLGEIAFEKKDYKTALDLFTDGADNFAGSKEKDATIGKAKTLLELGNYDEARKLFEQIATVREWRGESTAYAVYSLGEIEERQGHWAEAIAHFQRVFVLYQRYLPWVAKAYISCAESFDKLGKRQEAINHLKEMLRNEKLQNLPEAQQAKQMLEQWGETV